MKRLFLFTVLISFWSICFGQFRLDYIYGANVEKFKSSTTLVIVDEKDTELKKALEVVMPEYWTISDYKIIDSEEFKNNSDSYKSGSEYTFLTFSTINTLPVKYRMMVLTDDVGNKGGIGLRSGSAVGITDISPQYYSEEAELIKDIIFINQAMVKIPNNEAEKFQDLRKFPLSLEGKTLLIPEEAILPKKGSKIAKKYPYKYKVLSKEEISKAIVEGKEDTYVLDFTHREYSDFAGFMSVIDVHNKKVIYHAAMRGGRALMANTVLVNFRSIQYDIKKQLKKKSKK